MQREINSLSSLIFNAKTLTIPLFQRNYVWDEQECEQLFEGIVDSYLNNIQFYIGNIFLKNDINNTEYEIFDGQQRILSIYLLNLAVNCYLYKKETSEANAKQKSVEFKIKTSDKNNFDAFFELYKQLFSNVHDSKFKIETSNKSNRFINNYNTFIGLIDEYQNNNDISIEMFAEYIDNYIQCAIVKVSGNELNSDNSSSYDSFKLFDSLNSTGLPLTEKDIINSYIAKLGDKNLFEKWKDLDQIFEKESKDSKEQTNKFNNFIQEFFKNLGYSNVLIDLEKELDRIQENKQKISNIDKNISRVSAYNDLLDNMNFLYRFKQVPKIKYTDIDGFIESCFKPTDEKNLSESKKLWFKLYLDGIFLSKHNHADEACKLYLRYIYGDINLQEFFDCLFYFWVTAARCFIINYYRGSIGKNVTFKKIIKKNIALRNSTNSFDTTDSFVNAFKNDCNKYYEFYKENLSRDGENNFKEIRDDKELIDCLVNKKSDIAISYYVKDTHFYNVDAKQNFLFEYYLYLLIFHDKKNLNDISVSYKCYPYFNQISEDIDGLKRQDIGNIALLELALLKPENQLKQDNQVIKHNYHSLVVYPDKQLWNEQTPDHNDLNVRSKSLLTKLFKIISFDLDKKYHE